MSQKDFSKLKKSVQCFWFCDFILWIFSKVNLNVENNNKKKANNHKIIFTLQLKFTENTFSKTSLNNMLEVTTVSKSANKHIFFNKFLCLQSFSRKTNSLVNPNTIIFYLSSSYLTMFPANVLKQLIFFSFHFTSNRSITHISHSFCHVYWRQFTIFWMSRLAALLHVYYTKSFSFLCCVKRK